MKINSPHLAVTGKNTIHSTAIIETGAVIGKDVTIGPYCCVGAHVTLGDNVELISHVAVSGRTIIGNHTKIYPFASIGHAPQDLKYHGEDSQVVIGEHNTIREYVTIQPGTEGGDMITTVGDHCLFMVGSHVAHDCQIGNHVIMANNATLGGHVVIGDYVIVGGLAAIQQFVRIGEHAIIGGMSGVEKDVIPYGMVLGERAWLNGLNLIGLKRRGFSSKAIHQLRDVYQTLFVNEETSTGPILERLEPLKGRFDDSVEVMNLLNFIQKDSKRHLCLPKING